jgi:hypothetical protein
LLRAMGLPLCPFVCPFVLSMAIHPVRSPGLGSFRSAHGFHGASLPSLGQVSPRGLILSAERLPSRVLAQLGMPLKFFGWINHGLLRHDTNLRTAMLFLVDLKIDHHRLPGTRREAELASEICAHR